MTTEGSASTTQSWRDDLAVLAILWLCGAALRLTILAVPPVITAIQADLSLTGTQVGILSALPVVIFGLFAVPGSLLIARVGVVVALVVGLLITAAGAALRGLSPDVAALYLTTMIMGAGVAMMQVAMPAAVRQWMPHRIGFATAIYTNGLIFGEIIPVGLTIPVVLPILGGSWRWSLALWALPCIAIALVTATVGAAASAARQRANGGVPRWWPSWNRWLLWRIALIFASVTATYFASNAFLPAYLTQAGRPDLISPGLTALNSGQLPASFLLLAIASRVERRRWPLMLTGALSLVCILGIVTTASWWTVAWAALFGAVLGSALTLGLTLPAFLSPPEDVARVSAGMFTISYMLAVVTSILGGVAWDLSGSATYAFLPIALGVLPLALMPLTIRFPAGAGHARI